MLKLLVCLSVCFLLVFTACGDNSAGPSDPQPPDDFPGKKADSWMAPSGSGSSQIFNLQSPSGNSDRVYFWLSEMTAGSYDKLVCYANGYTQSSPEFPRGSASHYAVIPQTGEVIYSSYSEGSGTTVVLATADLLTQTEFTTSETVTGFIPMLGGDKILMCRDVNAVVLQLPSLARVDTVLCMVSRGFSVEGHGTYGYSDNMILKFDPVTCQITRNALTGSECRPVISGDGKLHLMKDGMLTILNANDLTMVESMATPSSSIFALHPVGNSVFLYTVSTGNTIDIFDLAELSWKGTVDGLTLVNPLLELISHPGRNELWGLTVNAQNRYEVFKVAP
jgi:hypothetical protein